MVNWTLVDLPATRFALNLKNWNLFTVELTSDTAHINVFLGFLSGFDVVLVTFGASFYAHKVARRNIRGKTWETDFPKN